MVSLSFLTLVLPTTVVSTCCGTDLLLIVAVVFHLGKVTGRDELLEDLHQILYGRKGKVQNIAHHSPNVFSTVHIIIGHKSLSGFCLTELLIILLDQCQDQSFWNCIITLVSHNQHVLCANAFLHLIICLFTLSTLMIGSTQPTYCLAACNKEEGDSGLFWLHFC